MAVEQAVTKGALSCLAEVGQQGGHGFKGQFVVLGQADFQNREGRGGGGHKGIINLN